MKLLRRILVTVVVTVAVLFAGIYWIVPIALSFYAARKAPPIAKVLPTDLKEKSVSEASGMRLAYLGYEFEVPWDDLDQSKSQLYPKDKPEKTRVLLVFRSGLEMMVTSGPPRSFADEFANDFKMDHQKFEAVFGRGTATSDYEFVRSVYDFTPDKMHYWSLTNAVHYREEVVLMMKSIIPSGPAETGIFNVENHEYKGFQQGDPRVRQDRVLVSLYSDNGGVEFIFRQKKYRNPSGVTQPEINRIVQSFRRTATAQPDPPAKKG